MAGGAAPGAGADRPLALVTGGCRRLGARIALALAEAGYALALHGRRDTALDPVLERALAKGGAEGGVPHACFAADFADPAAAADLLERATAHFGRRPDLLVNSAALFGQDRLETVSPAELERHYAVNCIAPVMLTRAYAAMPGDVGGCIVNILDQRLAQPHGDQLSYTLSKQALAGFTRIAARELAGRGLRVNGVAPGLTLATDDYDAEGLAVLGARMPLGRLPAPEDVAGAVLYLARARAVTGQVIAVDGGAHMESYARDFMYLPR